MLLPAGSRECRPRQPSPSRVNKVFQISADPASLHEEWSSTRLRSSAQRRVGFLPLISCKKRQPQRTRRNTKEICFRSGNPVFLDALESQRPDLNFSYAGWHKRREASSRRRGRQPSVSLTNELGHKAYQPLCPF